MDIIEEMQKLLPADKIADSVFEGANIVFYTKDRDFFLDNNGVIKRVVEEFKKRVELRPDPSICMEQEKAEAAIRSIIPAEAEVGNIIFDPQRSIVIIEADKPGLAIGKQGAVLREVRQQTFWIPIIRRMPAIRSKIIENVRAVLYENSDYRRKFLDSVGHRIYDGWRREKRQEWIRLTMLGAGRQVGRSCLFLQTPESRILMDCGIDPARNVGDQSYPYLEAPEFNIKELDAVILSHAHMDHCGMIPYLYKFGYRGPVYCTEPTRDTAALLQLDFVKIMRNEGKEPIYTSDEVREEVKHTITLDFNEVTDITPDVRITLYNSGHTLGSAMIHLHIGNGLHNMLYTADQKYGRTRLLDPAATSFPRLESMIIEATYGGKDNILPPKKESEDEISRIIVSTVSRQGKVLVPVLGTGRAQEVMLIVDELIKTGQIPEIPVYVDGMVWDITAIHTGYPEFLNTYVRKQIFHRDENPFLNKIFKHVAGQKERMQIVEEGGPCVILATSGMLVGGPSVEYLRHLADNPKNSLVFVSYQGEGSLGRRIQRGERELLYKEGQKTETTPLKMEIFTIDGLTGHSGRRQLMNFIHDCDPRPKKVITNHGEASRCLDLASSIHKVYKIETVAPKNLETVRIR
ncbi:MAG TPA: beta-CASP ribonuclease aCPSF1 [Candidatus Nanoarchaeia archaeon]|nr:beta-CASP ribonuclease aCPSF1 [Candidatus Nanoarchaeia archaeon]